jgi:hypothetical protein
MYLAKTAPRGSMMVAIHMMPPKLIHQCSSAARNGTAARHGTVVVGRRPMPATGAERALQVRGLTELKARLLRGVFVAF